MWLQFGEVNDANKHVLIICGRRSPCAYIGLIDRLGGAGPASSSSRRAKANLSTTRRNAETHLDDVTRVGLQEVQQWNLSVLGVRAL